MYNSKDVWRSRSRPFPRVLVELFASADCIAVCTERGNNPPLKLRFFVDAERRKLKKGLKLSVTENDKKGKSKMIASYGFLETCVNSVEKGVILADSVGALGVDLTTRVKRLGAKEQARKKCKVRFSLIKKNKEFQKVTYK